MRRYVCIIEILEILFLTIKNELQMIVFFFFLCVCLCVAGVFQPAEDRPRDR